MFSTIYNYTGLHILIHVLFLINGLVGQIISNQIYKTLFRHSQNIWTIAAAEMDESRDYHIQHPVETFGNFHNFFLPPQYINLEGLKNDLNLTEALLIVILSLMLCTETQIL